MAQVCIVFAEEVELAERVAELPVTILYLVLSKLGKKYRWQTMLIMIIIGFLLLCFALFFDFTCLRVFYHVTLFFLIGETS